MLPTSLLAISDAFAAKVYAAGCIGTAAAKYPSDYLNCENDFLNCVGELRSAVIPGACAADAGGD